MQMRKSRGFYIIVLTIAALVLFSSCLPTRSIPLDPTSQKPAGFLLGIWHGWIAPISLNVRLFNPAVSIYQSYNTGWWYDFGFYMAIISGFGGLSLARQKTHSGSSHEPHHR